MDIELLERADFISLHTPSLNGVKLISRENIDRMKDGVVFLNFSRDVLVDDEAMAAALESDVSVIFLLSGDILTVADAAARVRKAGKRAFVHLDLVDGLAAREVSVDFIARQTAADGIISTKAALTRRGRELGLVSIQRFFLLDSMALDNIQRQRAQDCDLIEVLPGLMPKIIRRVAQSTGKPVIAGGLISDKEDVTNALSAGAVAVSTTNPAVWRM